ncbi:phenylacetyl-CoA ligase-like protein [Tothia fuscella]|uniref:Phenylacetyl-CoA ligase-like protein n=1 Tax=Tothia fuscella TaxID=1048955 RepID=A0A9P4TXX1_9PEZI|nr:phenylacetyl-CoA ligase-like protein [Tothia fuscella]
MVFGPPEWAPKLPFEIPDSIPISQFMLEEKYGRFPMGRARPPFICGLSGKAPSCLDVKERVEYLARGLAKELGWNPNKGGEWDKVVGVFSINTLDLVPLAWATHRLGGVSTPANAAYNVSEVAYQLKDSGAKCLFTCLPLLESALQAAEKVGISRNRVYILETPGTPPNSEFKTVSQLVEEGSRLPKLEDLSWSKGEGARRCAFLCYSSGTSGLPKGVMISHKNVIANILQICHYDQVSRDAMTPPGETHYLENCLGLLPMSHIYGLVVICHASIFRGDGVVVLPKFDFNTCLTAIQDYKINTLYLVPPIIILFSKNRPMLDKYDLSAVKAIFTGAAPLGEETAQEIQKQYPSWLIRQGYGLTETCTVVSSTANHDVWFGSSGSIITSVLCRIVTVDGKEVTEYDTPGELLVNSPAVVLGYLNNDKANEETFVTDEEGRRWMKTGDEAIIKKSPKGYEHVFITDRIKELIKVKGLQVAPAELESHLLSHPHVADCAVIPVPDDRAGEVPKAYVVKSPSIGLEENDRVIMREICKHVEEHKSRHKWLKGGVEFIDVIPKSPSGKILRRLLRDKEKESRRQKGAKL